MKKKAPPFARIVIHLPENPDDITDVTLLVDPARRAEAHHQFKELIMSMAADIVTGKDLPDFKYTQ